MNSRSQAYDIQAPLDSERYKLNTRHVHSLPLQGAGLRSDANATARALFLIPWLQRGGGACRKDSEEESILKHIRADLERPEMKDIIVSCVPNYLFSFEFFIEEGIYRDRGKSKMSQSKMFLSVPRQQVFHTCGNCWSHSRDKLHLYK